MTSSFRQPSSRDAHLRLVLCVFGFLVALSPGARAQPSPQELRWAGDPEGGAPYVEASATDPNVLVGFDVEIANLIARGLGRSPRFVFVAFASIDQSVARGDAEIGLSGIEDTPVRRATMAATVPYYAFREVLSVRDADRSRFRTLKDLAGRRVGTLSGTIAYDILAGEGSELGITAVSYDDDVHPYTDLVLGRLDAVLLDNVLAERRKATVDGFTVQPESVASSHYVGVFGPSNAALRDRADDILRTAMRDGTLERIFRKWGVWNDDQPRLFQEVLGGAEITPITGITAARGAPGRSRWTISAMQMRTLVPAAAVTLVLSCLSMTLAVALGVLIASGRVYGNRPVKAALTAYVELIRGTPLLLQLFVLYYGLASAIRLPGFVAAVLGLALNYAAYESEIYRSALEAIPVGQLEAARTLGFTERQVLRLIRGPQAFRLALAPMTNDFVALLKDSSLVSVLTVVELTKQTQILATNLGSWVVPGALCAAEYLAMSLPLAALARGLERRWKAAA
jgi:polar amino acid transport system substrate-binding protein